MKRSALLTCAAIALAVLGGCSHAGGGANAPRVPCCYDGEVDVARASRLVYTLESGERRPFLEVFPGFRPGGTFGRSLPFQSVPIRLVTYDTLEEVLPSYDANANTQLESEELTALYLIELARRAGVPVTGVGLDAPVGAVSIANADISALMDMVWQGSAVNPGSEKLLRELIWLGDDIRGGNPPFNDRNEGLIWVNR